MSEEMLPCPWCGTPAKVWETETQWRGVYMQRAGCPNFDCAVAPGTDEYLTAKEAVEKWNARSPAATLDKRQGRIVADERPQLSREQIDDMNSGD